MKTEVIMKRELFGEQISQKSKSNFFSATDITKAGNKWRRANNLCDFNLSQYFKYQSSQEFIMSLQEKYGNVVIKNRGRGVHTWVHPLLFIDIALTINSKLKIEVYEWLFDNLIKFRNESGDSYIKMCGMLFKKTKNKAKFHENISKLADQIKLACNVKDWQTATQVQLKKRDKIHENITLLVDVLNNNEVAIRTVLARECNIT